MALKRLRSALGDDADSPRFIETIPKRGYRFIVPVHAEGSLDPVQGTSRRLFRWAVPRPLTNLLQMHLLRMESDITSRSQIDLVS